jgi:dihydropteroate synthase
VRLAVDRIAGPSPRRPAVWGVVNVTPDSFSDGGAHATPEEAVSFALRLAREGADVLDVGGESTRPGAEPVGPDEEAARVVPTIAAIRRAGCALPVSVDTRRPEVARAALAAGATIVNDVGGGTAPGMLEAVARHGAGIVLMHMRGEPATMQRDPRYGDVVAEVGAFLAERARAAAAAGVSPRRTWVDPGLGFGKTAAHNEEILRRLEALVGAGVPVLVGASRKSFVGAITGRAPADRLAGSLACAARAALAGAAAVRVHDVAETVDLLSVLSRVAPASDPSGEGAAEAPGRGSVPR